MEITVAGRARAQFRPERATVHLRLESESSDKSGAMRRTTELAAALSEDLARLAGLEPAPTTWSSVDGVSTRSWRPHSDSGKVLPMRHIASCRAKVKFRDFGMLSSFLDDWGAQSGVSIDRIEWTLTESRRVAEEVNVLARAVTDARRRAETMATAAGMDRVRFLEVADPGLLADRGKAQADTMSAGVRLAGASSPGGGRGIDLTPEDVQLSASVEARFTTD